MLYVSKHINPRCQQTISLYISALGFSLLCICPNQIITQLFEGQTRFICLSLLSLAPSVGGLFFPYLLTWLADLFKLSGTFLLLGGISLNTIPLVTLWNIPRTPKKAEHKNDSTAVEQSKQTELSPKGSEFLKSIHETLKNGSFLFLMLGIGCSLSIINIHAILALDILESNGLSAEEGILAVIVTNGASILSRLVPPVTNKIRGYNPILTPTLASLFGSSGMLLFIFVPNLIGKCIVECMFCTKPCLKKRYLEKQKSRL